LFPICELASSLGQRQVNFTPMEQHNK
jgi:hypothetical protein